MWTVVTYLRRLCGSSRELKVPQLVRIEVRQENADLSPHNDDRELDICVSRPPIINKSYVPSIEPPISSEDNQSPSSGLTPSSFRLCCSFIAVVTAHTRFSSADSFSKT